MPKVIENTKLAPKVHRLRVEVPRLVRKARAGQFVIVRPNEEGERVPMSIGGLDPEQGLLTMVIQEVGKTSAVLCDTPAGGELSDVVKAIAMNGKLDESRDFATQVQRALVQQLKPANRELRAACRTLR